MRYQFTLVRMAIIKNLQINAGEGVKKWEPSYTVGGNVNWCTYYGKQGFPGGSDSKVSACNAGDLGSIPGSGRSLEKEMATHSSILASKIPQTEEPSRLQSTGSQRVGHG